MVCCFVKSLVTQLKDNTCNVYEVRLSWLHILVVPTSNKPDMLLKYLSNPILIEIKWDPMWVLCILWLKFSSFPILYGKLSKNQKEDEIERKWIIKWSVEAIVRFVGPHKRGAKRIKIWSEESSSWRESPAVYLKQIFVDTKCLNAVCRVLSIWQGEIRMREWWSWRMVVCARMCGSIIDILRCFGHI